MPGPVQQPVGHFAPAPERRPAPGVSRPHTVEDCDGQLERLLREPGGCSRRRLAAFDVWLDERLRAMAYHAFARRVGR
jgi:hypothetical protein